MDIRASDPLPRLLVLTGLVAAAVLTRLLPHPPNFSPIEASALFAGAWFADRRFAVAVPLLAMLISDAVIGFHDGVPVVYACMAAIAWMGHGLRGRVTAPRVAGYGLGAAVFFFGVTNFFVWASSGMYALDVAGLVACYTMALPFFQNSLAGVAFYALLLFGGYALLRRGFPRLADARA